MARYVIYRISDGLVDNVCEWDGNTIKWSPPSGYSSLHSDDGNIGDTWTGSKFTTPTPPTPKEKKSAVLIDILKSKTAFLSDEEKSRLDEAVN